MKRKFGRRPPNALTQGGVLKPMAPQQSAVASHTLAADEGRDAGGEAQRIFVKDVVDIATQAWRARGKMIDPSSGEVREEMKRVIRHVDAILTSFAAMGFELKDHTGDGFDYGLPLRVVGTQPTAGLTRDTVVETLKPTIYWKSRIVQSGEVIVGTPAEQ
jgi:hypothetical protein